jgi:CRISPR-associated protein Csx14
VLRAELGDNPFQAVLEFLSEVEPRRWGPVGYSDTPPKKGIGEDAVAAGDEPGDDDTADEAGAEGERPALELSPVFPAREGDRMALPIRLDGKCRPVVKLGHWADGSTRNSFKLYAGNRSAHRIARAMLTGVRKKPSAKQKANGQPGDVKTRGITQLWEAYRAELVASPFDVLTPMGGSFNFDPRGAWTAIDAGYSPNRHKHAIEASPVVEVLAAWGLEHARPDEFSVRQVRYAAWSAILPPMLARVALAGGMPAGPMRLFNFDLDLSGKNKVVTFAQEEPRT